MAKLPYPDFSPRDNDWLYVYDQQISFFTDPYNGSHNYLLHKTMRELKDAGVEGYDLFGDPAAKAEDDLKNHVPHKMKVRYGATASPSAVLGLGAVYLGLLGFFWCLYQIFRASFWFNLTPADLLLPLIFTTLITVFSGTYALASAGFARQAAALAAGGVGLAALGAFGASDRVLWAHLPAPALAIPLALPLLLWWRHRNTRPSFSPVEDAATWHRRFSNVLRWRYATNPSPYLAEVKEHCRATGNSPQEEFGHPELYAYELERVQENLAKRRFSFVIGLLILLTVAAFIGFGLSDSNWSHAAFFALINLVFYGQYANRPRTISNNSESGEKA